MPIDGQGVRAPLKVMLPAQRMDLDPRGPSVSVVIPTLNEAKNLGWVAAHMPGGLRDIIVVDGGSTDGTQAIARSLWPQAHVIGQTRRGKGNALACGFAAATSDIVVMMDADGSMDPGEIPYFVAALVAGAEYAKGSRFAAGGGSSDITVARSAGNRMLNILTNAVHRSSFSDLCYGYNAFWRKVLPAFGLPSPDASGGLRYQWGDGFEVETLMNIRAYASGLRIEEVPSYESPRRHGVSNLKAGTDGLKVLRTIVVERRIKTGHWPRTSEGIPSAVEVAVFMPAGVAEMAATDATVVDLTRIGDIDERAHA